MAVVEPRRRLVIGSWDLVERGTVMNLSGGLHASALFVRARMAFVVVTNVLILVTLACGNDSGEKATPTSSAVTGEKGALTHDQAYERAVQGVQGDPAAPEGLSREVFEGLARTSCEILKTGGSVEELINRSSQQPTRSGRPLRRESVEAVVSAVVRGYCPEYASQLP
jgi:hypothetical protein